MTNRISEELRRCAEADAERRRNGTQDDYLNQQGVGPVGDWRTAAFDRACGKRTRKLAIGELAIWNR